jgi:hypothetical protein
MKTIFLFLTLLISNLIFGQSVKILFDATKAESAGNADWVMDADTHNIGFGSGPAVTGTGNESNAQRYPTPAQSGITASTTETFWLGSLSAWGVDCVKKGYTVETLPYNVAITYGNVSNPQDLSNYKVFIVCEPNIVFSASEKTAIMLFVQNGGGLFMVSDHDVSDRNGDGWDSPHIWNNLMSSNSVQNFPFGITFDYANFSETSTNIPVLPSDSLLHGPMGNVTSVMWSNGTSMTLSTAQNPSVKGIVYKTGATFGSNNVMMSYARFGLGKVAALGDSSPPDDGTGDPNDALYNGWTLDAGGNHERLIMNATIWLATTNATTTGIDPIDNNEKIIVYPNPSNGTVSLNFFNKSENASIELINELGQVVHAEKLSNCSNGCIQTIDISSCENGVYFLKIYNNNNIQIKKIMLEK